MIDAGDGIPCGIYHTTYKNIKHKEEQKMPAKLINASTTNKRDIARMTTRDDVTPLKKVETGRVITVGAWVVQEVTRQTPDGNSEVFQTILVRDAETGEIYGTRSDAFMRRFFEILEICADEEDGAPIQISITRGTGNSGREFVSCSLV